MMNALQTPNILIVEDEKIVAWDIRERLEALGYSIAAQASSGEAAIVAATQTKPDLVLMDIQLQGEMDGIETAAIIYRNLNIPVVYLTAHSDDHTLAAATHSHPFGYLLKPFQARELHSAIQIALHRHEQESLTANLQEWLANTLNSIGDATVTTDRDGRVTFMNPPAERLTAWNQEDALGELITQVVPLINLATRTPITHPGLKATDLDGRVSLTTDCLLRSKTAAGIPVRITATALTTATGERVGSVIVLQDITLQHRVELELWQRNQQLEQFQLNLLSQVSEQTSQLEPLATCTAILVELLEARAQQTTPQPHCLNTLLHTLGTLLDLDYAWIARHDATHHTATITTEYQPADASDRQRLTDDLRSVGDHRTITIADSPDFYQLLFLGVSWIDPPAALMPSAYATIVEPRDYLLICPIIAKQEAGQIPVIAGEVGLIATGKSAWTTPLQIKLITQIICYAASISQQDDATATIQAQQIDQEMLTYLKEDFISSVSHELKTPLENMQRSIFMAQNILAMIEPLAIGTPDFRQRQNQLKHKLVEHLDVFEAESRSETNLVNDLLNFQTAITPIKSRSMAQIPIVPMIADLIETFTIPARRFHQTLTYTVQPEDLQVFSHRSSLQRILTELLNNAIKYTPPNQAIRLVAQRRSTTIELRLTNTGIQIADTELTRIFQPFYRVPRRNPWDYCGTGLGLALIRKLSHQIGGSITVESSTSGTCFIFTLPQP